MTALDTKVLSELARPFTPAAIKFKVQTATKDKTKGLASFYIDARLAAERLNEVVGAENWTDEYRPLGVGMEHAGLFFPVECRLTVLGVTKADVGQCAYNAPDDKAFKSAYSDALKRAAVKYRIGAYLYNLPNLWAPVKTGGNGKVNGFTSEGETQLRGQYDRWLKTPANTYGEPFDHGDVLREAAADDDADNGANGSGEKTHALAELLRQADQRRGSEPGTTAAEAAAHVGKSTRDMTDAELEALAERLAGFLLLDPAAMNLPGGFKSWAEVPFA